MRRILASALLLVLLAGWLPAGAQEVPSVRDSAAVLSDSTVEQFRALSDELERKTGYRLAVDVRHFLGGAEPGAYARQLLEQAQSPAKTILLLAVIGEERYAVQAGSDAAKVLGSDAISSLLSMHFRGPFQAREYDGAVLAFATEAARQLSLHAGISLNAIPTAVPSAAPQPSATPRQEYESIKLPDLNSMLREPIAPTADPAPQRERYQREERGMSIGSIILIGLVLSALFGGKKGRKGCGCGPLGWIFGVFGASKMFGWRK